MSNRVVRLRDKILTQDKLVGRSTVTGFPTKIVITARNTRFDGDVIVDVRDNKTVLPGRLKMLEDNFPININFNQHLYLNDNVLGTTDISTGQDLNPITLNPANGVRPKDNLAMYKRRNVQWWSAGDGATNRTMINSYYDSHATDCKLFHMIPFRVINAKENLPTEERKNYKFEVIFGDNSNYAGYKAYYFKKIEFNTNSDDNGINMEVDGEDYTSNLSWADTVPDLDANTASDERTNTFKGDRTQHNYIQMNMSVTSKEFKEWFNLINGSISGASINEIGLISGLECIKGKGDSPVYELTKEEQVSDSLLSEVYDADVFAHLAFESYTVARENASIDFEYQIFS